MAKAKPKSDPKPKPKGRPKPARAPAPKSTQAEVARRVDELLVIILDGAQHHDIVQFAALKGWGVNERQLFVYARRALDLLAERQKCGRKRLLARHVAQRQALYARAVNAADYATALRILADEARLRGLYPSEKHDLKHSGQVAQVHVYMPDNGRDPKSPAA